MVSFDPMEVGGRKNELSRPRSSSRGAHRDIPRHGCVPAVPAYTGYMSAPPMTLNTTAETEMAKIVRGLRERDMELLTDLVDRFQHRLARYLLYLTGRWEYSEILPRRPGFACCNGAASARAPIVP
jgi:hypothetical protein